jgi:hypothetical protein
MMTTTLSKPWKISNKRLSSAAYADLFFTIQVACFSLSLAL